MDDLVLNLSQNIKKPTANKGKKPAKTVKRPLDNHEYKPENGHSKRFKHDERMQQPSKTAKFSSLFKNNPEIPSVSK
jgi:hypothetical protein